MGLAAHRRLGRLARQAVCREAVELMTGYLDGALAGGDRRRFERHLAGCPACTAYLDQMRATVATLGHLPAEALPPAVLDELVGLYRRYRAD
jgi:anti-sigma factor RsiW